MKKRVLSFLTMSLMIAVISVFPLTVNATCSSGIKNNGLDGLWIDINADPYTYFETKSNGYNAYTDVGCAWFASARSYQITGEDCDISSGYSWYEGGRWDRYGYSIGQECRAKSLACYYGHVLVIEKVVGNDVLISEGGSWYYSDESHGYCIIRWTTIDAIENNDFLGYVYLTSSPSFTPEYLGDHFFANIIHQKSGKAVVAAGDSTGSNVQINTHNGSLIQKWEFVIQSDGSYRIVNNHSGKSLDVNAASNADKTNVHVWDTNDSLAQFWYLKKTENAYQFVPKCALDSALDLEGGSSANGTNIQIFSRFDETSQYFSNQIFTLNYLPSFEAQNLGNNFFAYIIHEKSGKAVVAADNSSGSNVEIDVLNNSSIQKWEFVRQSDFSYRIINYYSGNCLDVNAASNADKTNVHIWNSNNSSAQFWFIKKVEKGYQLVPKCALNSALDLEGGSSANGTNIQIFSRFNNTSQYFSNQVFVLTPALIIVPGDANSDGSINAMDIRMIMRYLVGAAPQSFDALAADYNDDGNINAKDVLMMMLALVNGEI